MAEGAREAFASISVISSRLDFHFRVVDFNGMALQDDVIKIIYFVELAG